MDVEPRGEGAVVMMCHRIEDPTFDATADSTNTATAKTLLVSLGGIVVGVAGTRALVDVGMTVAWHNEEPSGGTRAAYAPGQVTQFWRALRRPVGRLYLAGEHVGVDEQDRHPRPLAAHQL